MGSISYESGRGWGTGPSSGSNPNNMPGTKNYNPYAPGGDLYVAPTASKGPSMSMNQTSALSGSGGGGGGAMMGGDPYMALFGTLMSGYLAYEGQRQTNKTNKQIAKDNNAFNAQEAEMNRKFQELMSNTSYQRGIADMKKSGINPLLSIGQGGASTPSGGSASSSGNPVMENALGAGLSSAMQATQVVQGIKKLDADIGLTRDQQNLTKAQTLKTGVEAQVATKGIPEADLKNKVYNGITNLFGNAKESAARLLKSNPLEMPYKYRTKPTYNPLPMKPQR